MKRVILFILLSIAFAFGVRAQMVNNIPNYLYSGSLGVGRSTANDANVYLQVGPNGAGTKGMIVPWVADTSAITGTKRNFLFIRSSQLGSFAYWDSTAARWYRIGFTDTTSIATRLYAEKVTDDTAAVLRAAISAIPTTTPLSSLTAATGTNTIDNTTYGQTWNWNSINSGYALTLGSTSTSRPSGLPSAGGILSVSSSGVNTNPAAYAYGIKSSVTNTGTSSSNVAGVFDASGATTSTGILVSGTNFGVSSTASGTDGVAIKGVYNGTSGYGLVGQSSGNSGSNYGVSAIATGVGASQNFGMYASASGASNNYALYTDNGKVLFRDLISSGAKFVKTNALGQLYTSDTLTASGAPISGLTAATGTNTINNADYAQEWQWNTLTGSAVYGLNLTTTSTARSGSATSGVLNISSSGSNSNSGVIVRGINSSVTNSGTTSQNFAVYGVASGAAAGNYGVFGQGTSAGVYGLSSGGYGLYGYSTAASGNGVYAVAAGTTGTNYGVNGSATGSGATTNYGGYFTASGATTNKGVLASGVDVGVEATSTANFGNAVSATSSGTFGTGVYGSGNASGVTGVSTANGGQAITAQHTGTSGQGYAVYGITSGAKTTGYAAYLQAAGATNNYALVTDGGRVGFGTTTPDASALVEIASTTQGLLLPRMTKTQRDAISTPVAGLMIYQTDNTPGLRVYNGTNWMKFTETTD